MSIPKIIHQLWIGEKAAPKQCMQTWQKAHPKYEYIFWNEAEIERRGITFECHRQIEQIREINGKADIMRWEILWRYGGFFFDADSICVEPLDEWFDGKTAFATYENENIRKGLVATGTMGFVPGHTLCRDIIDWILSPSSTEPINELRAWGSVGPALLTQFLNTGKYPDFAVFPSYAFLPVHFTGQSYSGHRKVYGYQLWGTGNKLYNQDCELSSALPQQFAVPKLWVSVIISSYNTPPTYVRECLDSIRNQTGYFGIEVVWINDGSFPEFTGELEYDLWRFLKQSRFTRVIYKPFMENRGMTFANNEAIDLATCDLIFKMDADDIMLPNRIEKQLEFMNANPDCPLCGANVRLFMNHVEDPSKKSFLSVTNHAEVLSREEFYRTKPTWFMNHPTLCFRKEAIEALGKYNTAELRNFMDDYELYVRVLNQYGEIRNLPDILVLYRIHEGQYSKIMNQEEERELRERILALYPLI